MPCGNLFLLLPKIDFERSAKVQLVCRRFQFVFPNSLSLSPTLSNVMFALDQPKMQMYVCVYLCICNFIIIITHTISLYFGARAAAAHYSSLSSID